MKFFIAFAMVALVALASGAEIPRPASKLEAVKEVEPAVAASQDQDTAVRGKRGLVLSAYSTPLTAAVPVAAAPVAYTYRAGLPYTYSSLSYSPYYSYRTYYL